MGILCAAIQIYIVICFIRVILSWIQVDTPAFQTVQSMLFSVTEPIFAVVRQVMPRNDSFPVDFSPMIVLFGLFALRGIVCGL